MVTKKILVLTNYSEKTNHARLSFETELLRNAGYLVDIFFGLNENRSLILHHCEKLLLKFLNLEVLKYLFRQRDNYDIFFFYGVHTLNSLMFFSASFRKKCIYQTLNHDIDYQIYELKIRLPGFFSLIASLVSKIGAAIEYNLAKSCGATIVNSKSLNAKFPWSKLNYYSSPLEGINLSFCKENPYALLYLGQLRREKILPDFFTYIENKSLKFFVFGKIKDEYIADNIKRSELSTHLGEFSMEKLKERIAILSEKWNLIGVSLIQEPHNSYKNQNANKDIDYLALGIPILGNYRNTTKELIEEGNGFFYDEFDPANLHYYNYKRISDRCKLKYKLYCNDQFKQNLLDTFYNIKCD